MLGKLTPAAIVSNPITVGAVIGILLITLGILALVTYLRKWSYLWHEWITSLDHKRIGVMYVLLSLIMLLRGMADATMMRTQQLLAVAPSRGYLSPDHFSQIFSAHGTVMIIFVVMPLLIGLMNIVVPLQIGSRDVAFPFLNSVSFWLTVAGAALVMTSLGLGDFSIAGWSGYAPLTEKTYSPDTGVDYWIWGVQIAGVGSLLTSINFLVTILKMRAPGMSLMRMPIFVWTALCTTILMVLAFPVLTAALGMLALDRYLGMHFFTNDRGGNMMMYVNLFWIWGHPEVYIVVLPAFGVFSEVVATFSRKRLFGYHLVVYATVGIMLLSFMVWVHHFFTMGAGPGVNAFFGITTMIIAVPTGVKVFNWLFTIFRGRLHLTTPVFWTLAFITTFSVGGMAGVLLAVPPADYVLHHGLFLVAHFHTMLITGSLFGYIAGFEYWFPKVFGFRLDKKWGRAVVFFWVGGFYLAFVPLYVLGLMGMPRRLAYYSNPAWHPYLVVAAAGMGLVLCGIVSMAIQLLVSIRKRDATRDLSGDPWNGRTLEWATSSPPPVYNFAVIPVVHSDDAFMEMKERGEAYRRPERYHDIKLPRNTAVGFAIGVCTFFAGFALVWHMWWPAVAASLGVLSMIVARGSNENTEYALSAADVEGIEDAFHSRLAAAETKGGPGVRRVHAE